MHPVLAEGWGWTRMRPELSTHPEGGPGGLPFQNLWAWKRQGPGSPGGGLAWLLPPGTAGQCLSHPRPPPRLPAMPTSSLPPAGFLLGGPKPCAAHGGGDVQGGLHRLCRARPRAHFRLNKRLLSTCYIPDTADGTAVKTDTAFCHRSSILRVGTINKQDKESRVGALGTLK